MEVSALAVLEGTNTIIEFLANGYVFTVFLIHYIRIETILRLKLKEKNLYTTFALE